MRARIGLSVAAVCCAFALVLAPAAYAAPNAWQSIDVTVHAEQSGGMLLISGELPETVSLPAEAELSVPTGSQIQWIGQILGGDVSADPALQYTKSTEGETDIYRFTLTESRIAQVEVPITDEISFDGTAYRASLIWTPSQDVPEVWMGVKLPASATIIEEAAGATVVPGETGYSYYSKTVTDAKAGQPLDLAFTYTAPAEAPVSTAAAPGTSSSSSTPIAVILIVAAAALVVLAVVMSRKQGVRPSTAPDTMDSDQSADDAFTWEDSADQVVPTEKTTRKGSQASAPSPEGWQKLTSENRRLAQQFIQNLLRSQGHK